MGNLIAVLGVGLAVVGLTFLLKRVGGQTAKAAPVLKAETDLDALYIKHGQQKGVDAMLLKAIARVESNENPNAVNATDPSYGLMQVLCRDGIGGCTNKLDVLDWNDASKTRLMDPDFNLHIASQILAWNVRTYGFMKGIAVYNSWGAHEDPREGPFRNDAYVKKVLGQYDSLLAQMEPEERFYV